MSFLGYKITQFLVNNLRLYKLFAVLWLFFYDFLWELTFYMVTNRAKIKLLVLPYAFV